MALRLVQLTTPAGESVLINPDAVTRVRRPHHNEFTKDARAVVEMGSSMQAVRESMEETAHALTSLEEVLEAVR